MGQHSPSREEVSRGSRIASVASTTVGAIVALACDHDLTMFRTGLGLLALAAALALGLGACASPARSGGGPAGSAGPGEPGPSASLSGAAAYAHHVDTTFDTITAIFQDAEGSSLEQYAADSQFAVWEQAWIAAQPAVPCLASAADQWAAAVALLKTDMDSSVEDFRSNNTLAVASANAQFDPARPQLLLARQAVDAAAADC